MAINKRNSLFIGCGACGGKQVDEIMELDKRYNCMYFNTSSKDVKPRKYAVMDKNVFCIPFMDGSGRDRKVTLDALKNNMSAILDLATSFENVENIYLLGSMAGGTGGASVVPIALYLIKYFRQHGKNIKVNTIFTKPKKNESKKLLENALECWSEIKKMYDESNSFKPNSIMFVDNDKYDSEDMINKMLAKDIDDAISLSAGESENVIDSGDLGNVMTATGNSIILRLEEDLKDDIELSIRAALENSIYSNYCEDEDCKYLCVSLKSEVIEYDNGDIEEEVVSEYSFDEIKSRYFILEDFYKGANGRDNIVVISGQELPEAMMIEIDESLKEKELEIKKRIARKNSKKTSDNVIRERIKPQSVIDEKPKRRVLTGSSRDFDDLLDDGLLDSFLN